MVSWFDPFESLRRFLATPLVIPTRCYPFRALPDGRECLITSRHADENPERSGKVYKGNRTRRHDGVDWMVRSAEGDPWHYKHKYYCPPRCVAVAAGEIMTLQLKPNNGARIWLDLGDGDRIAYLHLDPGEVLVEKGDIVEMGQELAGMAGRKYTWPTHLHLELSEFRRYRPRNPAPWFDRAVYLPPL
jgi:murein DD-endopeptidase MepM/ murein hydrolase activator NlpD